MGQIFKDGNVNRAVVKGLLSKRPSRKWGRVKDRSGVRWGKGNRYTEIARDVGSPCFSDPLILGRTRFGVTNVPEITRKEITYDLHSLGWVC